VRSGKEDWNFLLFLPAIVAGNLIHRKFFRAAKKGSMVLIYIFCTASLVESLNTVLWMCSWCLWGLEFTHFYVDGSSMLCCAVLCLRRRCVEISIHHWNEMVRPFLLRICIEMICKHACINKYIYIFLSLNGITPKNIVINSLLFSSINKLIKKDDIFASIVLFSACRWFVTSNS